MTTHLEIEPLSNDNGISLFRSQRIKINGKEAITPLKALDPNKFRNKVSLNQNAFGFNEIYKKVGSEMITRLVTDSDEHDIFSRKLLNLCGKCQQNDLNICVLKFIPSESSLFPSKDEIELLTDVAHSFSDITPIPLLNIKIGSSNFSTYLDYLQSCYDTIEELNSKPIMGALPKLPRELYPKLLKFYIKNQISSFCFDFDGRTPDHLKLRPILRYLNTEQILDQTLIYGINAKPGRTLKNTNVIPSKDFIAYGFGLDVLGENHIPGKFSKEFIKNLREAVNNQQKNKKRIFIKSDYGYYKTSSGVEIRSAYPSDTAIKLDDILHDTQPTLQKLFNMEQQSLEARKIRKNLETLDANETILTYVAEKEHIKKEVVHFHNAAKHALQTILQ